VYFIYKFLFEDVVSLVVIHSLFEVAASTTEKYPAGFYPEDEGNMFHQNNAPSSPTTRLTYNQGMNLLHP